MLGPEERFWRKVVKTETCWIWLGRGDFRGYGTASWGGDKMSAHRLAWLLIHGRLPEKPLHHTCRDKLCVNPAHLVEIDPADHTREHVGDRRPHRGFNSARQLARHGRVSKDVGWIYNPESAYGANPSLPRD